MKKISRSGFTLIELLIVIVIIGILSVAFLPTVLNAPKKARDTAKTTSVNGIASILETYATEKGGKFPKTADIQTELAKYYKNSTFPPDVAAGLADGTFKYVGNNAQSCYEIGAKLEIYNDKLYTQVSDDCTKAPILSTEEAKGTWYIQYSK